MTSCLISCEKTDLPSSPQLHEEEEEEIPIKKQKQEVIDLTSSSEEEDPTKPICFIQDIFNYCDLECKSPLQSCHVIHKDLVSFKGGETCTRMFCEKHSATCEICQEKCAYSDYDENPCIQKCQFCEKFFCSDCVSQMDDEIDDLGSKPVCRDCEWHDDELACISCLLNIKDSKEKGVPCPFASEHPLKETQCSDSDSD